MQAVHPQMEGQVEYNPYFYRCCILHSNSQVWKNQSLGYSKHYKYSDRLGPIKEYKAMLRSKTLQKI